jgi:hypothetical protein
VLRPGGRWAAWWSHASADDEPWFDAYWRTIEGGCPGTQRGQRHTDWGATVTGTGHFEVGEPLIVPWSRTVTADDWMTDQVSHSYVIGLAEARRARLLHELRAILDDAFPTGTMTVSYATTLWIARRVQA